MDCPASREQDVGFDLESGPGVILSNEEGIQDLVLDEKLNKKVNLKLCDRLMIVDDGAVKLDVSLNVNEGSLENNMARDVVGSPMGKEKRKSPSAKKPPRPPRGFSLDAYDQMLIKELTELAIIKRARIERMKALKQKKALKISSSSSSSHGTFAMIFTIIFFLVILLQGRNSGATFQGSHQMETTQTIQNGVIFTQNLLNPSASGSLSPTSKSSTLF